MTREQALRIREENYYATSGQENLSDDVDKLINEIYDSFESRTCESCKWYSFDEQDGISDCNLISLTTFVNGTYMYGDLCDMPKDFSCNKWEKKYD